MKITKRQLIRIIKEQVEEIDDIESHHWPSVDWTNIEDLVDKWTDSELKAWDDGNPSMNPEDENTQEMKKRWELQVDNAALDLESELTKRVRKVALETMKEFSNLLVAGEYL